MFTSVFDKLVRGFSVAKNFGKVFFLKLVCHRGKLSKFKITVVLLVLLYMVVQPWFIIRAALASSFSGYLFNNLTDNILDAIVQTTAT